jgi:spore coat protein H
MEWKIFKSKKSTFNQMNRVVIIIILFCRFAAAVPENLTLPVYTLHIDPDYLDALNDNPYSERYYPAVFSYHTYNYNCMVRYRGDTSRNLPKKSFKIKFDSDKNIFQAEVLNLNAEYEDKSLMRNYLGHILFRFMGQYAPSGQYVSLVVNDQFYGVYLQIEHVDEDFFKKRSLAVYTCFKGYNGSDMSPFLFHHILPIVWGQKIGPVSAYNHLELFMNKVTYWTDRDFISHIAREIDLNNVITYFALIYAITDYDGIHKNFYFFQKGKSEPYSMITWDMDCSFGNDPDGMYHQSYETSHERGVLSKHVLFLRLMEIPEYQQLFWQKIDEIRDWGFPNLLRLIENTYNHIKNDVYQDPQKICTNDDFDQAVEQLKTYLINRQQFLYTAFSFKSLSLYNPICLYPEQPGENEIVFRISSTKKQTVTLYLARNLAYGEWNASCDVEQFNLLDDGLHGDHAAGDLIYGNRFALTKEHQGVIHYAFYTTYESSPLHGFFYLKYHTHIGPAINVEAYKNKQLRAVRIGKLMQLADEYIVPIINPTNAVMDLSHFHFQAGAYYQRVVFPVKTTVNAKDTLFLTSNIEIMQELYPEKHFIEHIYFEINPVDTLKILSPTYAEVISQICGEITPIVNMVKDIVITEINYHSHANHDTKDWVELYNPNHFTVDISDWCFQDCEKENVFFITGGLKISPYEVVILCRALDDFKKYQTDSLSLIGDFDFNLRSEGEYICLKNESGIIIDSLTYRCIKPWPENTNGTGYTLMLVDPYSDNADGSNWRASHQIGGTPGIVLDLALSNQKISGKPECFILDQNYPNPFNMATTIRYFLLKPFYVELKLFTITGQYITTLESGLKDQGCYTCDLQNERLSSGLYIYTLYLNGQPVDSRKALHIK